MRFSRGVVKLPVKQIYLYLVIFSTTLYVCLQIANHQNSRSLPLCQSTHRDEFPGSAHIRTRKHSACTRLVYRKPNDCPDCFRPYVPTLSRQLRQVDPKNCSSKKQPQFFQHVQEAQQTLITDAVVSPTAACGKACPYLIVLVPTSAASTSDRNIIRATWASVAKTRLWPYATVNADVHVIFVTAYPTSLPTDDFSKDGVLPEDLNARPSLINLMPLRNEADQHGDILFLDMVDSTHNLTLKLLSGFLWVKLHCTRTKFVLKADMDTFVNIPLLLDLLIANEGGLLSSVIGHACFTYLENHMGSAYVISSDVLTSMLSVSKQVKRVYTDDQYSDPITADSYITGYLQTIIGYTVLVLEDFFASADDKVTAICDVIEDRKILGKVTSVPDMYRIWWGFFRFYAKCGNEDAPEKVK
ncbi:unnamed protein product [Lymnaea stagnalis]|uniref:Hexosyltransferase n=1 Tax=Lymnaea stagnalis TaxID=6523 RepID=A0AAV2H979_LYMST